ncbi:uncharacterized protein THITE_2055818 [Thermothielavioides terrestris NRRL 8126]|uniref:Zn(2)-C6 fungal-type domain-containing protein n=1 Tax=Thermothielavioides terrestris (strain ATCC 38088 / NRRL 8126) TaxID=578455 RepID=G2RCG9_THETT|nr:uncharacterized protein THITE_2055818 [Thermothielavioides terrestris NRRL 8126]AEO70604.1 hypothetical protein THITE_2055818 [Thermothielavioides terrestris NRRL 8126]
MEPPREQTDEAEGPPPPALARRYDVARSCLRCHERKVRCDKAVPCSTCLRAKTPCRYPGPERVKRRSARLPGPRAAPGPGSQERATAPAKLESTSAASTSALTPPEGILVKDGGSTRYINEVLFSRVLDQERELQSAIGSPASARGPEEWTPTLGFDGLLSNPRLSVDVSCLYPTRRQAAQLWQIYQNNVDPLLKLLHLPTMQPVIFAAINDPEHVRPDLGALLFSVYFAAVTSICAAEVQLLLGIDQQSALARFQRGLEVHLHNGSFLDAPTIMSMQAMSIYLMCRRYSSGGPSGWTLNGLLIRAAQWIGLHRDGEHFHLPPFDCEIRRRVWWQILGYDARVAEDHGLSTSGFSGLCDTKLPLNVDDRDLRPGMDALPASKPQWTEMTMFLVAAEMNQAMRQVSQLSVAVLNGNDKMASLKQLLAAVKARMEVRYLQHCDANIPIQKAALLLGRVLINKLDVLVRQQYLRGLGAEEAAAAATEDTLALACDTIEIGIELKTDELLSNYRWLFSTFTQYHLLTYALWHLRVRPEVPCADRAWEVVDRSFSMTEVPGQWPSLGSKWNVLRKLRDKAQAARAALLRARDAPVGVTVSENVDVAEGNAGQVGGETAFADADGMAWDIDSICFPSFLGYLPAFE